MTTNTDAVPAGWKLVPVEPTSEMVSAARIAMSAYEADEYELKATAALRSGIAHAPAAPVPSRASALTDEQAGRVWTAVAGQAAVRDMTGTQIVQAIVAAIELEQK